MVRSLLCIHLSTKTYAPTSIGWNLSTPNTETLGGDVLGATDIHPVNQPKKVIAVTQRPTEF